MFFPPRAYVFLTLNAVRILSVIALLLVFASNIFVMVSDIKAVKAASHATMVDENDDEFDCDYILDSTVPNQPAGAFWAILNRLFIIFTSILLLLSEIGWPTKFFINYLPVLGPDYGVGILGGIQWFLAASILSHHVESFPLVSAFFLFSIGCLNILIGLVFRASAKSRRSITTFRETKAKELLPSSVQGYVPKDFKILETSVNSIFSREDEKEAAYRGFKEGSPYVPAVSRNNTGSTTTAGVAGHGAAGGLYGFGRQGEKQAERSGFMVKKPVDSLPRYAPRPPHSVRSYRSDEDSRAGSPEPEHPQRIRTPSPPPPSGAHAIRSSPSRI